MILAESVMPHNSQEKSPEALGWRIRSWSRMYWATVVGLLPMAFKLETGSEAYAPLARVIIGGLLSSIVLTIFVVPAAYLLIYQRREAIGPIAIPEEAKS